MVDTDTSDSSDGEFDWENQVEGTMAMDNDDKKDTTDSSDDGETNNMYHHMLKLTNRRWKFKRHAKAINTEITESGYPKETNLCLPCPTTHGEMDINNLDIEGDAYDTDY